MIFDATCKQDLQWKIALERPRTEKDENFFEFCTKVQHMIDIFPRLAPDDLTSGKCYFIKYGGRYYRGVFISLSRDNRHAIFDFADFDGVRPIPFKDIRPFPKRNEICVPFMIFWVYTNECNFKENDRVYCKFSGTFENTSYRKFYQAKVQKIEN
uniref:Tudor domain-containing protein n=1 Tax=Panagrolaimus superbus TaxID=310955 RepID=A0A914ZA43_9BILA